MSIEIGSTVEGTVVKIVDYGALVRLPSGEVGLVHISEIADAYVRDVRDYLRENARVLVKILKMNDKGRYVLSTKQADAQQVSKPNPLKAEPHSPGEEPQDNHKRGAGSSTPQNFEARLARFLKESEERLLDLKRNIEAKRGGKK